MRAKEIDPLRQPTAPRPKPARAPRRSAAELEALRYAARCAFTLEHQPVQLEDLARRPAFRGVGLPRLRAWAEQEGWQESRRANIQQWRHRAQARLAAHVAHQSHSQRAHMQALHDQAVALRQQQVVQPKSWEQVAAVQLKTAQLLRQWQQEDARAMAAMASPAEQAQAAGGPPSIGDDLSDHEVQQAAHDILERRLTRRLADEHPAQAPGAPVHQAIAQAQEAFGPPPDHDHHLAPQAHTA